MAREFFTAEHGREPADARELAATIAKHSRPKTQAVAGYDLTFSPVKSVSVLWALADPETAAKIEKAHRAAIDDALTFIETEGTVHPRRAPTVPARSTSAAWSPPRSPTATLAPAFSILM